MNKEEVVLLHRPSPPKLCGVATPSAASQGFRRQRKGTNSISIRQGKDFTGGQGVVHVHAGIFVLFF